MRYILLLRGINVGGKNKVAMSELKALLEGLNFQNVHSYINSGNLFFTSIESVEKIVSKVEKLLEENYFLVVLIHLIFVFAKLKIC